MSGPGRPRTLRPFPVHPDVAKAYSEAPEHGQKQASRRGPPERKVAVFEWLYAASEEWELTGVSLTRKHTIARYGKMVADALDIDIATGRKWAWQWSLQFRNPGDITPEEQRRLRKQDPEAAKNIRRLPQHFRDLVQKTSAKRVGRKQPVAKPAGPSKPSSTISYHTLQRKLDEANRYLSVRRQTRAIENQTKAIDKLRQSLDLSLKNSASTDSKSE